VAIGSYSISWHCSPKHIVRVRSGPPSESADHNENKRSARGKGLNAAQKRSTGLNSNWFPSKQADWFHKSAFNVSCNTVFNEIFAQWGTGVKRHSTLPDNAQQNVTNTTVIKFAAKPEK